MTRIDLPPKKTVGHLTLLRDPRTITPAEFNALSVEERLEIVRRAPDRKKYDLLIEAAKPAELLHRMPAQEAYLLVKEVGHDDAVELVAMASVEQLTTFVDLDSWEGDCLDGKSAYTWLEMLLEAGEAKVLETFRELDFELLVLMLQKQLRVLRTPGEIEDKDAREEAAQHWGGYEIEYPDSEQRKVLESLLGILLSNEEGIYRQLLDAVRWEPQALLEENVYHVRSGRLEDRGFPDPFEALAVYAWLDPEGFETPAKGKLPLESGEAGVSTFGLTLTGASPQGLLAEVLAGGLSQESSWELTFLLNKVMVAERIDVGDREQVEAISAEVYGLLNLALEHLSGGDVEKAAQFFADTYLEHLFRLGYSLTLQLQRRAKALCQSGVGPYLDGPFRALTESLGRRKPRYFTGLERTDRGGEKHFAELRELTLAAEWLERLEVQRRLFEERFPFTLPAPEVLDPQLEGCLPESAEDLTLSDFFLTALANRVLGRDFIPLPVPAAELPELHRKVVAEGRIAEALRAETAQWLDALEPGGAAFGDYCLELWQEEFGAVKAEELDPRYIGGLIVREG